MDTKGDLLWRRAGAWVYRQALAMHGNLDGDGSLGCQLNRSADNKPVLFAYDPVNGAGHETFLMELGRESCLWPSDMNGDGRDEIEVSVNATGIRCIGYHGESDVGFMDVSCVGLRLGGDRRYRRRWFCEVVAATQNGKIVMIDKIKFD